ncbi:GIY-YIG nuclease family protein [Roseateles sp.]|uniref:GIY-YIG nuclease family protein n=1 Tax=Roseateles sp. TaxID=1971397 RepID=UPI003BA6F974
MKCSSQESGIYAIRAPSGNLYIGSAANFNRRANCHRSKLVRGVHFSKQLQDACNKYGIDALVFTPVFRCGRDDLIAYEQAFIDALAPAYNSAKVAGAPMAGRKHGDGFRKKIAATRAANPETVAKAAKKAAETRARAWAEMTPEEMAADAAKRKEAIRIGNAKRMAALTPEQRAERVESLRARGKLASAAAKARLLAMTPEERAADKARMLAKRAATYAKKTPEEIAEINRRRSIGMVRARKESQC